MDRVVDGPRLAKAKFGQCRFFTNGPIHILSSLFLHCNNSVWLRNH